MKKCLLLNKATFHEEVLGSGGILQCILNLGTRWSVVSCALRPLYPQRKSLRYPVDRRLPQLDCHVKMIYVDGHVSNFGLCSMVLLLSAFLSKFSLCSP